MSDELLRDLAISPMDFSVSARLRIVDAATARETALRDALAQAREAARKKLTTFERAASKLVPADYATGYREACEHIGAAIDAVTAAAEGGSSDE